MNLHDPSDMVFVFGSNLSGIHGAGAARTALKLHDAEWGVGEGLTGKSYALPTKGHNISFMPLDEVRKHIQKFMKYSYDNRDLYNFQVTRVGTGLSGFRDEDIAEIFHYVAYPESNCFFDTAWRPYLPVGAKYWGTF
ncbi:MAG: hypothetical protein LC687_00645 [Actinobacteria bacterium]|nr:hypothetical protein [Actinomycetota bacterium]MCA1806375.1 hypothetical protein [Actinomycetota bacterium]